MLRPGIWLTVWLAGCGLIDPQLAADSPLGALEAPTYTHFQLMPQLPRAKDERPATKLTYLMTDESHHQSAWSMKKLQMLDDLPQQRVHNVVFRDGEEIGDSRIYYLTGGNGRPDTLGSSESLLAPGTTEVQSNNPQLFAKILAWTLDHYPGRHKYLQLYTHGSGVSGIGTDSHQTDPQGNPLPKELTLKRMSLPQFAEALRQGLKGRQLDLIYFRACLMGNVEALYELRGTTRFAIASEDTSSSKTNSNITMTQQFDAMANQGLDPAEVARALAIQAHADDGRLPNGEKSGYTTIAAVDISRLDELKQTLNELALALRRALPHLRGPITQAYDQVPAVRGHDPSDANRDQMRDLWAFTTQLQRLVPHPGVQAAVARAREAEKRVLLHTRDAFGSAAHGLSIYLPVRSARDKWGPFLQQGYLQTRFAQDSAWDEFLTELLTGKTP